MQLTEFVNARNRICQSSTCYRCPLGRNQSGCNVNCTELVYLYPKAAERIVRDWLKSHKEEPTND